MKKPEIKTIKSYNAKTQKAEKQKVCYTTDNLTHNCLILKPSLQFDDNGKIKTSAKPKISIDKLNYRETKKLNRIQQINDIIHSAIREYGQWRHPRTHDLMITTGLTKTVSRNDSSCGIATRQPIRPKEKPSISYHRRTNQPRGRKIYRIGKQIVFGQVILGKPTGQYKTVWFSKHNRRK